MVLLHTGFYINKRYYEIYKEKTRTHYQEKKIANKSKAIYDSLEML